jgi:uncharacterized RDD family membrane protein YckC
MTEDAPTVQAASVFGRFFANMFDSIFVTAVGILLTLLVTGEMHGWQQSIGFTMLYAVYEVGMIAFFGRTLGKRVLRQRVVVGTKSLDAPGVRVSFLRYAVKSAFFLYLLTFVGVPSSVIDFVVFVIVLAVTLSLLSNSLHRGFHDRIAGTYVVSKVKVIP